MAQEQYPPPLPSYHDYLHNVNVGAEIPESPVNVSSLVVPAMTNVHTALKKVGLHKRKRENIASFERTQRCVRSTDEIHDGAGRDPVDRTRAPIACARAFDSKFAFFLKPMLEFQVENQFPFMIDLYPYYAYRDSSGNVSLDYALFKPSSSDVIDPNTGFVYTNMFDTQMDAIFFALMALNFTTLKVLVTESGWPNMGSAKEAAATSDNAQSYNTNLIRHVINDTGTPAKPDQTSIFSLDFTGKGSVDVATGANITSSNGT